MSVNNPLTPADTGLDPIAILSALGWSGTARAVAISGGADTALWRIDRDGQLFALRVFRPEQSAVAEREVVAMDLARAGGLPVPAVHAAGVWRDRPALVLTWMPGRPLRHELIAHPLRAWSLGASLGRTQAALHTVPMPPGPLDLAGSWVDWASPDDDLKGLLLERAHGRDALLHLDLHPMNVLVHGQRATGVLDWANARRGDVRADLARTASLLHFIPFGEPGPPSVVRIVRRVLVAGWRRGYRDIAGSVHGMAPFYAWAGALMVKDLSPRLGRPDLPWLTPAFLDEVRRWTVVWREASLPE